jgi:hypothetical protein
VDPAGVLSAGDKNAEVKCGREKKLKFRTIESLPPSCSDEDKYIQKNTSIQGIFRVFFYCRHAKGVIKWFLVSKMVGPFYTVSPQACEDRRKQRQNLTTGGKQK